MKHSHVLERAQSLHKHLVGFAERLSHWCLFHCFDKYDFSGTNLLGTFKKKAHAKSNCEVIWKASRLLWSKITMELTRPIIPGSQLMEVNGSK